MLQTILLFGGAVIFNMMAVNVLERRREIATMRTLGQSRRRLRSMIALENMLVGVLSLVPGLGAETSLYLAARVGVVGGLGTLTDNRAETSLYLAARVGRYHPRSWTVPAAIADGNALAYRRILAELLPNAAADLRLA